MGGKPKGANAEREIVDLFWSSGWSALRIAGSGRMNYPSPDILASNGSIILAIECKATKKAQQYFEKEQIDQLISFSKLFGASPLIAVKFSSKFGFYALNDLKETSGGKFVINKSDKSREFSQIL